MGLQKLRSMIYSLWQLQKIKTEKVYVQIVANKIRSKNTEKCDTESDDQSTVDEILEEIDKSKDKELNMCPTVIK